MAKNRDPSEITYLHSMTIFDMNTEKTSVIDVPSYIPIIGQNLVFLPIAGEGVLVVLGGYTESDGELERVGLNNVYMYDMTSGSWSVQPTTDREGGSKIVPGSDIGPKIGIPEARDHMCTVVGSAPDKSSHNLYVFGGKNNTDSLGDIWALSLPR
ncbi:MAG: hypothetical protein Q9167_007072 [Letrouitia subvulpina]